MKRVTALLLACRIFLGTACAAAEEATGTPKVVSYDFDLRFHLEADLFPFRERKLMQGYEELLDALEIKGNYSWCDETECLDLNVRLIPVSDPDAEISFRIFGWLPNWLNVSSPLLGENPICFRPDDIMNFTERAWDFFHLPLFPLALLFPTLTINAFDCLADDWVRKISKLENKDIIPGERVSRIAEYWQVDLESDETLTHWIQAATKPLSIGSYVKDELESLAKILLYVTDGETLTVERDGQNIRYVNHRGETLYAERRDEQTFEAALTLPDTGTNYKPAFSYREEKTGKDYSFRLEASWDRISDMEELPETLLRANVNMEHIPSVFPADHELSGEISVEGAVLPNFHYLVSGVTHADGSVYFSLAFPDKPEVPMISCSGTVIPVPYEGELEYTIGDIITDYNLFALSDQTLTSLMAGVVPNLMEQLPDFLYAMPTHGIQSILDTLEQYGLLQITLQ